MAESSDNRSVNIEKKLSTLHRVHYKDSHISLNPDICRQCSSRICVRICPANVYTWDEKEEKIDITYENCLECGTCMVACEMQNIEWVNPPGGAGIVYRQS